MIYLAEMPSDQLDVFMCFAPEDRDLAALVGQDLEARGIKFEGPPLHQTGLVSLESPRGELPGRCRLLVVLLSDKSVQSDSVKAVLTAWLGHKREDLIPVLVDGWCDWATLPEGFRYLQFVRTWKLRRRAPADRKALAEAISYHAQSRPEPTKPTGKACIYCGKPLGLLRPDEFCSDNHRREYDHPGHRAQMARERELPDCDSSPELPQQTTMDNVHFTVTALKNLRPGKIYEIHFWVHLESQRQVVLERAVRESGVFDAFALAVRSEGPVRLAKGTALTVQLRIEDLVITENCKFVLWSGEVGSSVFLVGVPEDTPEGSKAAFASIRVNGFEIARMTFLVYVCNTVDAGVAPIKTEVRHHKTAFASYASQDRDAVLARVQGIQTAAPTLDVFLDVMSLRAGEDWERRLFEMISKADVFYLFWCNHASASEWVQKEWRYAFDTKGLDFIDPVPLVPPQLAPPPTELAKKHFNDPILAFIQGLHS